MSSVSITPASSVTVILPPKVKVLHAAGSPNDIGEYDLVVHLQENECDGESWIDMEWKGKHTKGQSWCRGSSFGLLPNAGGVLDFDDWKEGKNVFREAHFQDFRRDSIAELIVYLRNIYQNNKPEDVYRKCSNLEQVYDIIAKDPPGYSLEPADETELKEQLRKIWMPTTITFVEYDEGEMYMIHDLLALIKELESLAQVVRIHGVRQNWH